MYNHTVLSATVYNHTVPSAVLSATVQHNHTVLRATVYNHTVLSATVYNYTVLSATVHNHTVLSATVHNHTVLSATVYNHTVLSAVLSATVHNHTVQLGSCVSLTVSLCCEHHLYMDTGALQVFSHRHHYHHHHAPVCPFHLLFNVPILYHPSLHTHTHFCKLDCCPLCPLLTDTAIISLNSLPDAKDTFKSKLTSILLNSFLPF